MDVDLNTRWLRSQASHEFFRLRAVRCPPPAAAGPASFGLGRRAGPDSFPFLRRRQNKNFRFARLLQK
jgi:hypothetical protein